MEFASDNWSGVAAPVAAALSAAAEGFCPAYGESESDRRLELRFNELFETRVHVFFVGTGTAANSLALSAVNRPGGFVMCHRDAHLIEDECGAPEFFTGGARMCPIDGERGKIDPTSLRRELDRFDPEFVHHGQPMAVSITQATEVGTLYQADEIAAICELAHGRGLPVHMDGARFAAAIVGTGLSPAEMTWKQGLDVLSFGATKNGCWCAEAIVFFDGDRCRQLPYIRKRAAQLFSKTRFIATQFHAYLDDDLWLTLAKQACEMARRLAFRLDRLDGVRLAWPVEANEVFVTLPRTIAERWKQRGAKFYPWPCPHDFSLPGTEQAVYRFVTSFSTSESHIDEFIDMAESEMVESEMAACEKTDGERSSQTVRGSSDSTPSGTIE